MGRVGNKVAIVTGAASGVGKEDALLLAREGARVVLTDINEEAGRAVSKEIGDAARFIRHDVACEADWVSVIATTRELFGGVDVLVNNAAILVQATIEETTLDLWQRVQRINSDGYFLGCKHVLPPMKERPSGSIINMSSLAGIAGLAGFCAYSASKAAVAGLTRSVAAYCRSNRYKIRCNSVHPDGIATPMASSVSVEKRPPQAGALGLEHGPSRLAQAAEIANVVLFLASDESSFMSGAQIRVDNRYSV